MATVCSRKSVIFIILVLIASTYSQEPDWFTKVKQIKVLESTKQDVERVFNSPVVEQIRGTTIDYKFDWGRLSVSYSKGKCSLEDNRRGYDFDKDIILGISLFLFKDVKISELNLDLKNFEKHKDSDTNALTYSNDELGIEYSGDKKTIYSVDFYPANKYDHLYCKNVLGLQD